MSARIKRDENIVSTREQHAGTIKHAGDGVVLQAAAEPRVVVVSAVGGWRRSRVGA
jgi:hypothetical protein